MYTQCRRSAGRVKATESSVSLQCCCTLFYVISEKDTAHLFLLLIIKNKMQKIVHLGWSGPLFRSHKVSEVIYEGFNSLSPQTAAVNKASESVRCLAQGSSAFCLLHNPPENHQLTAHFSVFLPRELVARSATFWKASRNVATATTVALWEDRGRQ